MFALQLDTSVCDVPGHCTLRVSRVALLASGGRRSEGMLTLRLEMALSRVKGTGRITISALPSLLTGIGLLAACTHSKAQHLLLQERVRLFTVTWLGPLFLHEHSMWTPCGFYILLLVSLLLHSSFHYAPSTSGGGRS